MGVNFFSSFFFFFFGMLSQLYKGAGEDVIQLFDLAVIPKNHSSDNSDDSSSSLPSPMHRGRSDSLFSLGTLLYRIAHRLSLSVVRTFLLELCSNFLFCPISYNLLMTTHDFAADSKR